MAVVPANAGTHRGRSAPPARLPAVGTGFRRCDAVEAQAPAVFPFAWNTGQ